MNADVSFLPLKVAASRLGVPARWLRVEADAGRIPCLRAGRRMLVNPSALEAALLGRAAKGPSMKSMDGGKDD